MSRFEKMSKLTPDELGRISGGTWDYDTVSDEDREEMDRLFDALWEFPRDEAVNKWFHEFLDRMDEKYGPNEPLI